MAWERSTRFTPEKKISLACLKSNQGYASFFLPELSEYYLFFNLLKDKRDEL